MMLKKLILITAMIITADAMATNTPLIIKGRQSSAKMQAYNMEVPNHLATQIGTNTVLVENGNQNLLQNPSFEHSTFNTGWTCTGISPVLETTVLPPGTGKKGIVLAGSGSSFECYQDATLGATYAEGTQLLAMIMARVGSSVTGTIKVCARQANTTSSTLCATVVKDGVFRPAKIPFLGNSSSNGIAIVGTTVTGNVYLDHAFVGAVDLKQDVDASSYVGSLNYVGAASCVWQWSTVSTWGIPAADTDCSTPTTTGIVQAPPTKTPAFILPNGSPAGIYDIRVNGYLLTADAATECNIALFDGTSRTSNATVYGNAQGAEGSFSFRYTKTDNLSRTISIQLNSTSGFCNLNAATANRRDLNFDVYRFASASTYSSTNADTDWAACSFSTLAWQGLGTVTSSLECRRDGGNLLMRGNFQAGILTASEVQIPLPLWNGAQLKQRNFLTSIVGSLSRDSVSGSAAKQASLIGGTSFTYLGMNFYGDSSAVSPLARGAGTNISSNGAVYSVTGVATIPIEGWENSNVIIGQFNNIETCKDSYECTDTFTAETTTTGAIVAGSENVDWINGDCAVSSGLFTCNLKTGLNGSGNNITSKMNCLMTPTDGTAWQATYTKNNSSTSLIKFATKTAAGADVNSGSIISCSKAGADYIGKTAKAVASDQNLRTVGAVNSEVFSFTIGSAAGAACTASPCTFDQIGSTVTGITRAGTGNYPVALANTYSKLKCFVGAAQGSAGEVLQLPYGLMSCTNCNSITIATFWNTAAPKDAYANIICHGVR